MSLSPNITITLSSKDRQILDSLKRVEKGLDGLSAKNLQRGLEGSQKSMRGLAAGIVGLQAGMNVLSSMTSGWRDQILRTNQDIANAASQRRDTELKLALQGGFTPRQIEKFMPTVEQAIQHTPAATLDEALVLQRQLASSGLKQEDIDSGAALTAALETKAMLASFGRDTGNVARDIGSMVKYLNATGTANPGAADIRGFSQELATIFKSTTFEFPQLETFAAKAAPLHQRGMSRTEILSTQAYLSESLPADVAASGLQSVVLRTSAAGAVPERAKALGNIGIDPAAVAMSPGGPQFGPTVDRLTMALERLGGEERNVASQEIFGMEGAPAAALLTDPALWRQIQEAEVAMRHSREGAGLLETFRGSEYADQQRERNRKDIAIRKQTAGQATWKDVEEQMDAVLHEKHAQQGLLGRSLTSLGRLSWGGVYGAAELAGAQPSDLGFDGKHLRDAATAAGTQNPLLFRTETRQQVDTLEQEAAEMGADGFDEGERRSLQFGINEARARLEYLPAAEGRELEKKLDQLTAAIEGLQGVVQQQIIENKALKAENRQLIEATRQNTQAKSTARPKLASSGNVRSAK